MPGNPSAADVTYNNLSSGLIADDVQEAIDELASNTTPDDVPTSGSTKPITSGAVYTALAAKQNRLTFDSTPVSGSNNPVKSGGLYTALSGKQNTLTFDSTPISGSNNPVKSGGIYTALAAKQNTLTFDSVPTANSTNPVRSNGIYNALAAKQNTLTFDTAPRSGSSNPVTSNGIYQAIANKQGALVFDDVPISGSTNPVKSNGIYTALAEKANTADIPSKYTSTPAMNGTGFAGNSGKYADGNHVHPTDTSRVPTTRTINGYDLSQNRSLTAADVGALGETATAERAKQFNAANYFVASSGNWFKIFEIQMTSSMARHLLLTINNTGSRYCGIVYCYFNRSSDGVASSTRVRWLAIEGFSTSDLRVTDATLDGITTFSLYLRCRASNYVYISTIRTMGRNGTVDVSDYWRSEQVAAPPDTAINAMGPTAVYDGNGNGIASSILYYTSVAVATGEAQQILSISNSSISADHILARIEFADPNYITAGYTWTTASGSFILTGTATAATTANVLLVRKGN